MKSTVIVVVCALLIVPSLAAAAQTENARGTHLPALSEIMYLLFGHSMQAALTPPPSRKDAPTAGQSQSRDRGRFLIRCPAGSSLDPNGVCHGSGG